MAMNILICGFGVFGRKHAEAWKKAAVDCKLLVADINPEMRKAAVEAGCNARMSAILMTLFLGRTSLIL